MNIRSQLNSESDNDPKKSVKSKNKLLLSVDTFDFLDDTSVTGPEKMPCKLSYFPIGIILILIVIIVLLPVFDQNLSLGSPKNPLLSPPKPCMDTCNIQLVESIPEGLVYNSTVSHPSTFSAWKSLIDLAQERIQLAGMYWSLRGKDVYEDPSDWQGEQIFDLLKKATKDRHLELQIAQNQPRPGEPNRETEELAREVGAQVRNLNFTRLMGDGILHTKLWIVDGKHFYVGSANMDWRSLTQVKEMGVLVTDCACMATDMNKIFDVYWELGQQDSKIPSPWPAELATNINSLSRLNLTNPSLQVYLSSSPPPFCPQGREVDVDAIVKVINTAEKFINIAVMDYFPTTLYTRKPHFWPVIDDAIRKAAIERGVEVRMLISHWDHTRPNIKNYLKSLQDLSGAYKRTNITVKMFTVPSFTPAQANIPFARVNHNKYLVTDKDGYIGTSNWSADYFISTGGIGVIFRGGNLRRELKEVFDRDWGSSYSHPLEEVNFIQKRGEEEQTNWNWQTRREL